MPSIRAIYQAENADMALIRLEEFEAEWGKRYPAIGQAWRQILGACHPVLRVRAGDPQNDLHDKLRRGAQPLFTENHQNQRKLPNGRGGV